MWVEALDLVLADLRAAGVDLRAIRASAGPASSTARSTSAVDRRGGAVVVARAAVDQVRPLLSRKTAPIWMDASTGAECAEITKAAGGADKMVADHRLGRHRALHRPQIRKFGRTTPPPTSAPPRSTWCRRSWRRC
jgi:xylulokinase